MTQRSQATPKFGVLARGTPLFQKRRSPDSEHFFVLFPKTLPLGLWQQVHGDAWCWPPIDGPLGVATFQTASSWHFLVAFDAFLCGTFQTVSEFWNTNEILDLIFHAIGPKLFRVTKSTAEAVWFWSNKSTFPVRLRLCACISYRFATVIQVTFYYPVD